jgi:Flp pilus assembly protein TadD
VVGVEFERHVEAACGYAELGMSRESLAELDAIPARFQQRPEVLQLRLHHFMRSKRWTQALRVSQKLCRVAPDCGTGFLHAGFCLHQLGKTEQARELLITGPVALLKEPIYYYNMGCYEALLGNVHSAHENLQISFKMDASFRDIARRDPDLAAVKDLI